LRKRHSSEGRSAARSQGGAVRGGSLAGADDGEGRERGRSEDGDWEVREKIECSLALGRAYVGRGGRAHVARELRCSSALGQSERCLDRRKTTREGGGAAPEGLRVWGVV
jgi:hypothetical protein